MQNCGYNYYGHFNEFTSIVFKVSLMALLNVRIHKTFLEAELQFSKSGCMHKYFYISFFHGVWYWGHWFL